MSKYYLTVLIITVVCLFAGGCALFAKNHSKQSLTEETIQRFIADAPMVSHIYSRPPSEKIIEDLPGWPGGSHAYTHIRLENALFDNFYERPGSFVIEPPFSAEEMQLVDKYEAEIIDALYLIGQTYIYTEADFIVSLNTLKLLNNYLKSIDSIPMTTEQHDELYRLSEKNGVSFTRLWQLLFVRAVKALDKKWEGRPLDMVAPYLTPEEIRVAKKYADELKMATDEYGVTYQMLNPMPHPRETRSFLWHLFNK